MFAVYPRACFHACVYNYTIKAGLGLSTANVTLAKKEGKNFSLLASRLVSLYNCLDFISLARIAIFLKFEESS